MAANDSLHIADGRILSPEGITGYVDYGRDYLYVCFYQGKIIVAEYDSLNSLLTHLVKARILEQYYYVFKILCTDGVTAVIRWSGDIVLVGITSGYYETGERIWMAASEIQAWPGKRET